MNGKLFLFYAASIEYAICSLCFLAFCYDPCVCICVCVCVCVSYYLVYTSRSIWSLCNNVFHHTAEFWRPHSKKKYKDMKWNFCYFMQVYFCMRQETIEESFSKKLSYTLLQHKWYPDLLDLHIDFPSVLFFLNACHVFLWQPFFSSSFRSTRDILRWRWVMRGRGWSKHFQDVPRNSFHTLRSTWPQHCTPSKPANQIQQQSVTWGELMELNATGMDLINNLLHVLGRIGQ